MRYPAPGSRVIVVIPTYNEAENLLLILDRLRAAQPSIDVLVVDDGSPDGTGALADEYALRDAAVHVLHRTSKEGLGAAYLAGFAWALDQGYDVIGEMDADGSHQPEQMYRLLDALPNADLVIGSRYVPGGSVVNWPKRREWLSRGGNTYIRALLGVKVRDVTAGYRLFHRETLIAIDIAQVESTGYVFQADLAYRTLQAGLRVREVPIEFIERVRGKSKMSADVATESLRLITDWGIAQRRARRKNGAKRNIRAGSDR
ncbi:MAG TPA: polyprenol monophosphomannose synthase [Marmoricola sp.]|nr:polyprenol monophosphomannose synthase [Marmoricola sp.]